MNIYFGKVPTEYQEEDDFIDNAGEHYYYCISTDSEGISIKDTCNRYVPMNYDSIEELLSAIICLHNYAKPMIGVQKALDMLTSNEERSV